MSGRLDHLISLLLIWYFLSLFMIHISWFFQDKYIYIIAFYVCFQFFDNFFPIRKKLTYQPARLLIQWTISIPLQQYSANIPSPHHSLVRSYSLTLCSKYSKGSNYMSLNIFNTFKQYFLEYSMLIVTIVEKQRCWRKRKWSLRMKIQKREIWCSLLPYLQNICSLQLPSVKSLQMYHSFPSNCFFLPF